MFRLMILALMVLPWSAVAQDSLFSKMKVDFNVGFGAYYQFSSYQSSEFSPAKIPRLLSPRRADEPELRATWNLNNDLVTNNPLFHGAYFFDVGARVHVAKGLDATVMLTAEQRGFSDGRFSQNTINIFPYFNLRYHKELGRFSYALQVGDFYDIKLYEGLTYYNLQTSQAWSLKLKYENFYIKHFGIGDLTRNIGLGIDDLYDFSFGLEDVFIKREDSVRLNVRVGLSDNTWVANSGLVNYSANLSYRDRLNGYAQLSTRNTTGNNRAFLIGASFKNRETSRFLLELNMEYRRYGAAFNRNFINNVYYRNPNEPAGFTNSTHTVFFPLITFERPFSQWAVFTEYQDRDVSGFTFRGRWHYRMFSKTYLKFEHDLNWITAEGEGSFLYPFYTLGVGAKPSQEIELFFEITNRVLNLDKHYPTLYAAQNSYFLVHVFKPIRFRNENDQLHRH